MGKFNPYYAHLYGLTKSEFVHILSTFPLVGEDVKSAAMGVFRKMGISKMFMNDEELDYIINYDVKYGIGVSTAEGEDE